MSKSVTAPSAKTAQNGTAKKREESIKAIFAPSAESRIKKLENFTMLTSKYKKLAAKKDELDSFNVGSDALNEKITLTSSGHTFEISNSQVIADLKLNVETKLVQLLEITEKEIVNFEI